MFLRNPGRVVSRAAIATRVWGFENLATTSNSLNVYIGYLRRKTEAGGRPRLVHTVRGVGYILREP
jgi:two-component system response regulator MprA